MGNRNDSIDAQSDREIVIGSENGGQMKGRIDHLLIRLS